MFYPSSFEMIDFELWFDEKLFVTFVFTTEERFIYSEGLKEEVL
jgi:hypothetical protein